MKIGIEPDGYSGILAFDIDNDSLDKTFLFNAILRAKTCDRSEVDIIIKVKEDKRQNQTNE